MEGSVITVFHLLLLQVHALRVMYSTGILAGGGITTRPASSGRERGEGGVVSGAYLA